jgi:hypothetical protein
MPAYSFQKRFVPALLAGLEPGPWVPGMKRQTIRRQRKQRPQVDTRVVLYTGMRTRHCRKLGEGLLNVTFELLIGWREGRFAVAPVFDLRRHADLFGRILRPLVLATQDRPLTGPTLDDFACADGFADAADMEAFWSASRNPDQPDDCCEIFDLITWRPV